MVTRTSSRQAATKAKEAISSTSETAGKATAGAKRKAEGGKSSRPRKEKKEETNDTGEAPKAEPTSVPGTSEPVQQQPKPEHATCDTKPTGKVPHKEEKEKYQPENVPGTPLQTDKLPRRGSSVESGVRKSEEREEVVSSNILEKGIIYFFFRPRVNVEDPHGVGDVARSFFVLRPTPMGAELDENQGPVDKDARCRLLVIPKKKFPNSRGEREMGFVEKSGQSMKDLHENFIAARKYETATRGERNTEEARPYAEGVYAITSTKRASHLAYVLTIPSELGEIQENFGLYERGSWIVQSKNPKYSSPSYAQLPKDPEYPESVREKFKDLRWVPLEPEFIEYPNSQFLMIGEAQDTLGKAATSEGRKQQHEQEPDQELEKLEEENEHRVEALEGDKTIFEDLGLQAKNYPKLQTTWAS